MKSLDPIIPGILSALAFRIIGRAYMGPLKMMKSGLVAIPLYSLVFTGIFTMVEFWRRQALEQMMNQEEFDENISMTKYQLLLSKQQ